MNQLQVPFTQLGLAVLSADVVFLLLGIYGWEYVQSLHVEYALISGRLAFRASVIPYILGRACLLVFLVLVAVTTSPYAGVLSCLPGTLTMALLGDITLGCSSANFLIRTWVIWKDSHLVRVLLLLLVLGHWSMLVADVTNIKSVGVNGVCDVHLAHPQMNAATLIYTTFFDLFVFVLSFVGLAGQRLESPLTRRLRAQGILYIAVAGIFYVPPVVSALLGNIYLYVATSNVAITISTMVSSRAVRSLHSLDANDSGETLGNGVALTTQIGIQGTLPQEDVPHGPSRVMDEADRC